MRHSTRPLPWLNPAAASGVALFVFFGWFGLTFFGSQRQELSTGTWTSRLSMQLLELGVAALPRDEAMRLQLARKRFEAGQIERARELVLREWRSSAELAAADRLLVEIDFARVSAAPFGDRAERERRIADLRWTLDSVVEQSGDSELLLRIAALYRELELPLQAATFFDGLARRTEQPDAARIALADATWLEAGQPLAAADLQAYWARHGGAEGPLHARLALERVRRAGGSPAALAALIKQLRELYPRDIELLELMLSSIAASDAWHAYDLALELSRLQPSVARHHREAARLAEATGRSLCALDQYMWLWRHEHRAADKARALRLARELSDLQLLRELLDGTHTPAPAAHKGCGSSQRRRRPLRRRNVCDAGEHPGVMTDWDERYNLYEMLGDIEATRALLRQIVGTPQGNTVFWWRRKLALERRLEDYGSALQSLTQLRKLAPESKLQTEIADLQLAMGDARAALGTLQATSGAQRDAKLLRDVCALSAAVGDIAAEREAYEELVQSDAATLSDYRRLLALATDEASAASIASAAAVRFESYDMFSLAFTLYKRAGDEPAQLDLLKRVELLDGIARHVEYWQLRVTLQQERAARAALAKNYGAAKVALASADDLLHYAAKTAPGKQQYAVLWGAQHAQALSVGIASGDNVLALRAFLATRSSLSARERVYLLIKLGQPDQALEEAKRELGSGQLRDSDRSVLESDAFSLRRGRAADVEFQGHSLSMDGLQAYGAGASVDYAEIAGGLRIRVGYTEYQPSAVGAGVLATDPIHDMTGSLRGRLGRFALELGANVRNAEQVRPFGALHAQIVGDDARGASLELQGNVPTSDNARMRAFATADEVAFKGVVGFGKYIWASARAAGDIYVTRAERRFLGYGATVDLGIGSTHELPANIGSASMRVFGRGALRFPRISDPNGVPDVWLPESVYWTGVGASLARGQLNAPLLFGRQVSYALDAAAGLLWPEKNVGWTVNGQLGVSCFGADSLLFNAAAGNVLGASGISGSIGYIVSFAD